MLLPTAFDILRPSPGRLKQRNFSDRRASYSRSGTVNDDSQLIDEALAGNSASFGQLVRRYQDRLYNTMFHVVHCAEEAQDVVQEAFVQAFVKLETFQRTQRLLHLAVPDCLQHGRQPQAAAAAHGVGGTVPAGDAARSRSTAAPRRTSGWSKRSAWPRCTRPGRAERGASGDPGAAGNGRLRL